MSSNLLGEATGDVQFAYNASEGWRPWHNLGTAVPGLMTCDELIIAVPAFGAEVVKQEMLNSITGEVVPDYFQTIRLGPDKDEAGVLRQHHLGVVGNIYNPLQDYEFAEVAEIIAGMGAACFETVGLLGDAARSFWTMKLPEVIEPVPDDVMEDYLVGLNDHTGKMRAIVMKSGFQLQCENTFMAALKGCADRYEVRHTATAKQRLREAADILGMSDEHRKKLKEAFKVLVRKDMSRLDVMAFMETIFPGRNAKNKETGEKEYKVSKRMRNIRDDVEALFAGGQKASKIRGRTAYAMLTSVTEWIDHHSVIKGEENDTPGARWERSMFSDAQVKLRQSAFDTLLAMTN